MCMGTKCVYRLCTFMHTGDVASTFGLSYCMHIEEYWQQTNTCVQLLYLSLVALQNGQLMYTGYVNHKNPLLCPVVGEGLFQLWRYGIEGQQFPDLTGPAEDWYVKEAFSWTGQSTIEHQSH